MSDKTAPADVVIQEISDWFERDFPCREYGREVQAFQPHLKAELGKWLRQRHPEWNLVDGTWGYTSLFGWSLNVDLEIHHQPSGSVIPIEAKVSRNKEEYVVLHAMAQAISYANKAGRALALVVDQGRGSKDRSEEERKLQEDLWTHLHIQVAVRKP